MHNLSSPKVLAIIIYITCSHILGTVHYFESYITQAPTVNASMQHAALAIVTSNDIQIPFLKLSEKQYYTAGVYQSSTQARNND